MTDDRLHALTRTRLEAIQSAVDTILALAEEDLLPDPLESELYVLRDRVISALGNEENSRE